MSGWLAIAALSATLPLLLPNSVYRQASENALVRSIKAHLENYYAHLPEDRIYLQLDKTLLEPGDDLWLSGYICDGQSLRPSTKSGIVHVELIGPKGNVEKTIQLIAKHGKVQGDFSIGADAPGGLYKLKAYTNWMKNDHVNACFEKDIQVQDVELPTLKMTLDFERKAYGPGDEVSALVKFTGNDNKPLGNNAFTFESQIGGNKQPPQNGLTDKDGMAHLRFVLPQKLTSNDGLLNVQVIYNGNVESISRSIPITLNKINLSFYPEGGDMVNGISSRVAFKALNEFGKPADIEGVVTNQRGQRVCTVSSYHQGMGAFVFTPVAGAHYKLKITKPAGINQEFILPAALEQGYTLKSANTVGGDVEVTIGTSLADEVALVAQVRGKIYYNTVINVLPGDTTFTFSTKNMPAGVCQLTVFDSQGIPRAERLCFVNRNRQLQLSIETDKEKYLPREKVKLTLVAKDERGLPVPARLSMAVVNDQLLTFANDKSGNIVSQLLLEQDLNTKVEEPAFYFNTKEPRSAQALDYLLMTAGWRRFTWEKLLQNELPPIFFAAQKAEINGTVRDVRNNQPLVGAHVKTPSGRIYNTSNKGSFTIPDLNLCEALTLTISAAGYDDQFFDAEDYEQLADVSLYPKNYQPVKEILIMAEAIELNEDIQMAAPLREKAMPLAAASANGNKVHQKSSARKSNKTDQLDLHKPELPVKALIVTRNLNQAMAGAVLPERKAKLPVAAGRDAKRVTRYYRARQFQLPEYNNQPAPELRTDFRNTIYWNPDIEIGFSGRKTIEFYASDEITSFKASLEGIGSNGFVGRTEKNFFTQLPFELQVKLPVELASEDIVSIPVTLKNNTDKPIGGLLKINAPAGLKAMGNLPYAQTIMPGVGKTVFLDYSVQDVARDAELTVAFEACGMSDAISRRINIVPRGFPAQVSFSGQDEEKEYRFEINNLVKSSLSASFCAYPNVVTDLLKGVEGILQEPSGCFEQTSCTAYPNAMVLDYLKATGSNNNTVLAQATGLLNRGYSRLTTFETRSRGYEWFGSSPAHEGLTAYGIMEFTDMKKAGQEIDESMLDRTVKWLLGRRNGKGGFEREARALHDFGRISDEVMNAYIVYALAEAGYTDIEKEFEAAYNRATESKDPYLLAMSANAAFALGKTAKATKTMDLLLAAQNKDGSFNGATHSITYSQGNSLTIETTALSILAMLKSTDKAGKSLEKAVSFLVSTRSGSGVFSSTQGTILALKCLTEYAKFSKHTQEGGTIQIYVDGKSVAEKTYAAGEKAAVVIDGLEKYLNKDGKHTLKIKYKGCKQPLPYSVGINWHTFLPQSDTACQVKVNVALLQKEAKVGETVRLNATLTNTRNGEIPSTVVLLGIPAGLSVQPWQLKELQEKMVFDYYEINGNNLALYYRGMAPKSVKTLQLDLKAELPGTFDAPASTAYLYYTNEYKNWCSVGQIRIKKP